MTWDTIGKALMPSVQSAVYALLATIATGGVMYAVNKDNAPPAPPIAQRTVPTKTIQSDQTRLQLVGIQHTLDQIAEVARELNAKECVARPQKAAAKAK